MFGLFSCDIGIDLGTANTLVHVAGQGIVINEPTVIAVDSKNNRVSAIGFEAKKMLGRTPGETRAVRPMRDGVIADFELVETLLQTFIKRVQKYPLWMVKPRVVVGVPSGITEVEKRAVIDAAKQAGAKEIRMIHEPMAAAIGIGIDVLQPEGHMVVDIGGGTAEIAVISLGGIVCNNSIRVAGDVFNDNVVDYMKRQHNMIIGVRTAEKVKIAVGAAVSELENPPEDYRTLGRDLLTGLPKEISVNYKEIAHALDRSIAQIEQAILDTLAATPPELAADIYKTGIYLAGGGALLRGLDQRVSSKTKLQVHIADDPLRAVARGTGIALKNFNKFAFLIR